MKIHELITALQQYDLQAEVVGTWEGETTDLAVYESADSLIVFIKCSGKNLNV